MTTKTRLFAAIAMGCVASAWNVAVAETHTANDKNGVPGMTVSINDARIRHSGQEVVFYPIFRQTGNKNIGILSIDNNDYAWIDDEGPIGTYMPRTLVEVPSDGEPVAPYVELRDVPLNATAFTKLKIVGRAPDSPKVSDNNYYGDFTYTFSNIPIPQFKKVAPDAAKGLPGGMFTDNEIELALIGSEVINGDGYIYFTLTNVGRSNKQLQAKDGYATTLDGERLSTTVKIPQTLDSGDTVKGTLIVPEWASQRFSSVKHNFYVGEKDFHWNPQLILK